MNYARPGGRGQSHSPKANGTSLTIVIAYRRPGVASIRVNRIRRRKRQPQLGRLLVDEIAEFVHHPRPQIDIHASRGGHLPTRPVGRPPNEVRRLHASFGYQAQSRNKPRGVVAKVEWHPGELHPRIGFIVTNMARPAARAVAFYHQRRTCEQRSKEGKRAIKWTLLSCRSFVASAVRLQPHALACKRGNFMRPLAMPETPEPWSLTRFREKFIKIGASVRGDVRLDDARRTLRRSDDPHIAVSRLLRQAPGPRECCSNRFEPRFPD